MNLKCFFQKTNILLVFSASNSHLFQMALKSLKCKIAHSSQKSWFLQELQFRWSWCFLHPKCFGKEVYWETCYSVCIWSTENTLHQQAVIVNNQYWSISSLSAFLLINLDSVYSGLHNYRYLHDITISIFTLKIR